jgi:tol-pal system protein YbgF
MLLLGAGCLTAETSERRQLADLERGIEGDHLPLDPSMRRGTTEDPPTDPAAPRPSPAPRASPLAAVSPPRSVETDEAVEPASRTVIRIWGKNASSVEVAPADVPAKVSAAAPPSSIDGEAQHAYDAALALVNAQAFDKAVGAFGEFLLHWPSDTNASNAMYWQAESYYAMSEYTHASELLEQTMERFPKSGRIPDCLLKLGLVQQKLGNPAKAKAYFDRLVAEYPRSEAARRVPKGI